MRIRRLKLAGFKSFVDPAELVIEPGLTGIVGPNGCGKSNLLEAIRWVMGEASPKSLRGGGMDDVIFAGTAQRPARAFAEVALALERTHGDGATTEAEVVRRIERGAGSAYRLDGRDVRQKDVALLFADAATGAHSPALVSQGRIGAIIAARPAERRAMLEEAAGIAGLHVRRRDAEQKLRATEANLERLDQLLGEMDGRVATLRRQARAAERYRLLSAEIRLAEARLIYARWRDAAAAAAAARREAEAAEAAVARAGEAHRAATEGVAGAADALARARLAAQATRDAAGEARHARDALRGEAEALERRLAELHRLRATIEHDRAREGALAEDAAAAIARLGAEGDALAVRILQAEASRPETAARLAETESALRDREVALAQAVAAEAAEQAETRIARAALAAARQRLDRAEAERQRIARDQAALERPDTLEAARDAAQATKRAAEAALANALAAIETAEAARAAAVAARDSAQAEAATARAALASLEGEAKALARSLPPAGQDRALDRLRVAPGFERALAAALGDDLAAPIAATGRLRWDPAAAARAAADTPLAPGCTRLLDHVEAPVALHARLAQIGVVTGEEGGAIPLAPGQRLVTRDGRLRRWDGFVADDQGAATAEGLIRRNRLAALERDIPEARAALAAAEAEVRAAAAALGEAERAGASARAARGAAEAEARGALLAQDRAESALERLAARRLELEGRAARAAEEGQAAQGEADLAAARVAALPDGAATAAAMAAARAAAEAARSRVAELRADLAALDRGLAADRERRAAAAAESKSWRGRAGDAARRIADLAERAARAEAEASALAPRPAALVALLADAEAAMAASAARAEAAAVEERAADQAHRAAERAAATAAEAVAAAREARATAAARMENHDLRRVEMGRIAGERFQCPAPVLPERLGFAPDSVMAVEAESQRFEALGRDRERLGPVNLVAEQELAEIEAERGSQAAQRDELTEAVARLRGSIASLNREGRTRLRAAFEAVDGHFRRLFTRLFAGGEAHLALVDSDDPLEAGLEIMAQPPGKRLTSLTLLSGGEQALTACALIFALFLTNPAPLCVLDEVDAPLDDANIERFCDLLDQMVRETDTRYLVVTHNAVTMARMHRLFGVTMVERGVSRLVSVDLGGAESLLAAE
ncbi:chromosome segregation protein SMC [Sphingomonas morindae]|uniref:Chromosome partition protein Smc n=1 Tax=Sphingomonas morindae TaxID=1541170 RepID=A0ABY4X5C6_9SPHN|nr:chromosome segregation protein SMC [Sphingomonas morindae]USI72047.1 chromosome segregation protein SMC [Sphingomonas morindae]